MKTSLKFLDEEKKYPIIFTLNVMETIQEIYGSLDSWKEKIFVKEKGEEPKISDLLFGLTEMVNEGIEIYNEENLESPKLEKVSKKQVGRIISRIGIEGAINKIGESIVDANSSDDSKNE